MRHVLIRVLLGVTIAIAMGTLPAAWGQQPPILFASVPCPAAGVTLTAATETSIVTAAGITTKGAQTVRVWGVATITTAALTTAVTLRIRRGSGTGGTSVGTPTAVAEAASTAVNLAFAGEDAPGEVAGQQYSLTAQATGPAANGTVNNCELWVLTY